MLKLIKWNFLDYIKKNYWIPVGLALSFLTIFLPRSNSSTFNNFLIGMASIAGISLFLVGFLSAISFAFQWIEKPSVDLELSLPVSAYQQIAAKLITSAVVNAILMAFLMITARTVAGFLGWIQFLTFLEGSVLFAAILAHSYRWMRRATGFFTVLVSLALICTVTVTTLLVMAAGGQIIMPTFSTDNVLSVDGSLQILSPALPNWIFFGFVLLEWLLGSRLLQNRFQAD